MGFMHISLLSHNIAYCPCNNTVYNYASNYYAFLRELGCHLKQVTGEARSFSYLRQRLSVAVQRGNAAAVMGTRGAPPPLLISFLDCLFLFGALTASPLTDCLFFTYLLHNNI